MILASTDKVLPNGLYRELIKLYCLADWTCTLIRTNSLSLCCSTVINNVNLREYAALFLNFSAKHTYGNTDKKLNLFGFWFFRLNQFL